MVNMNKSNTCISTAFFHVEGHAPNLGNTSQYKKLEAYYKCMVVFFASARRFNPESKLVLFSNDRLPDEYTKLLDSYNVFQEILKEEDIKYCNMDLENNFPGCLFTLDVIEYCSKKKELHEDCDSIIICDSDCVFIDSINSYHSGVSGMVLDWDINRLINNQSRSSLSLIRYAITSESPEGNNLVLPYYGGELYVISSDFLDKISGDIRKVVEYILYNKDQLGNFFTEEHILSIVFDLNRNQVISDKKNIKRVWTADTFHNIEGNEKDYKILHYPAEKNSFFKSTFDKLSRNPEFFQGKSDDEVRNIMLLPIRLRLKPPIFKKIKIMSKTKIKNYLKKLVQG